MGSDQPRILVWDWTVRLFHWLTVFLVALMWWSAEQGIMGLHTRLGVVVLGLLVFRIVWGLIGPPSARFSRMIYHPRALIAYLRDLREGRHKASAGHNPAGVLSVFAMLAALCVQVGSGLFSVDVDGLESGPLSRFVSFEAGRQAAEVHETSFNILIVLIALHLIAIVTYALVLRDNLVRPMLTGRRASSDFGDKAVSDNRAPWLRVVIGLVLALACMAWLFRLS